MKCFFHSADLDGHCSGALVKYAYPECEMIGINYGDDFPWDSIRLAEQVYLVDFSLQPFSDMLRLNERCRLTWIDHHKTAIQEESNHSQFIPGARVEGLAGCELTWDFLFPESSMPAFVYLLGRYDVWDHTDPRTINFQMGMRMEHTWPDDKGMRLWTELLEDTSEIFTEILVNGRIINSYQSQQNEKYAKSCAFETTLDGLNLIAANAMLTNSKLFDSVFDPLRHDAMCTFGWRNGGWKVSLYSVNTDQVDVSKIAKARGGGGHAGAAGFQCTELPFELR